MELHRVAQRLLHMLLPGRVTLTDDSDVVQRHQVDFGPKGSAGSLRIFDKLPHVGRFGFTSVAPLQSEVLTVFLEGDPSKGVVIGTNHQPSRMKNLQAGDSAMHDVRGAYVWLSAAGLHISAANLPVLIENATTVTVKASGVIRLETPNLNVTGEILDHCDANTVTLKALRDDYNAHKHPGVQSGSSSTGTTDHPAT